MSKPFARFVEPILVRPDQHANFTQFVFRQTHLAALNSTHSPLQALLLTSSECAISEAPLPVLPLDSSRFPGCDAAELRERLVELIGKFDQLADGGHRPRVPCEVWRVMRCRFYGVRDASVPRTRCLEAREIS
jgi:hypothetical protein